MPDRCRKEEVIQRKSGVEEKVLLKRTADLLMREGLINPDEKFRFLELLNEEE